MDTEGRECTKGGKGAAIAESLSRVCGWRSKVDLRLCWKRVTDLERSPGHEDENNSTVPTLDVNIA
jgi:hypothetical protein